MASFNNLKSLEKFLKNAIDDSLEKEVAVTVKQQEQEVIQDVVYDAYAPLMYQRRGEHGGGLGDTQNMIHTVKDGHLKVLNLTPQNSAYPHGSYDTPYIAEFVERGKNYDYWGDAFPRPFTEKTTEQLNKNDEVKKAIQQGLNRNGINTK